MASIIAEQAILEETSLRRDDVLKQAVEVADIMDNILKKELAVANANDVASIALKKTHQTKCELDEIIGLIHDISKFVTDDVYALNPECASAAHYLLEDIDRKSKQSRFPNTRRYVEQALPKAIQNDWESIYYIRWLIGDERALKLFNYCVGRDWKGWVLLRKKADRSLASILKYYPRSIQF